MNDFFGLEQQPQRAGWIEASEQAADTFVLGGNAMDNLTGQGSIFDAPGDPSGTAGVPLFATGGTAGSGVSIKQVEDTYQQVTDGLKNAPLGKVVQLVAELPFDAPSDLKGVYWKGSIYLVADNLGPVVSHGKTISPVDVIRETIAHEMIGHYGLRGFFGRELDAVLSAIHESSPGCKCLPTNGNRPRCS